MNNDLISREALKKKLQYVYSCEYIGSKSKEGIVSDIIDNIDNAPAIETQPQGEWKVKGIGINTQKNIWHVVCPKCNCDMFTEFTSYCPNCGEPKKEINIAELDMRGDEE